MRLNGWSVAIDPDEFSRICYDSCFMGGSPRARAIHGTCHTSPNFSTRKHAWKLSRPFLPCNSCTVLVRMVPRNIFSGVYCSFVDCACADPSMSNNQQYISGCMRRRTVHELQEAVSQANFSRVLLVLKFTCKEKSSGTFQCRTCLGAHMSRRYRGSSSWWIKYILTRYV